MDALIWKSIGRALEIADLGLEDTSPERVRAFCDTFSHRLVALYLGGQLTWLQADAAANNIYVLMVRDCGGRVPDYAWDVYLAFDAGEYRTPGEDATTRPLIEEIVARYGPEGH